MDGIAEEDIRRGDVVVPGRAGGVRRLEDTPPWPGLPASWRPVAGTMTKGNAMDIADQLTPDVLDEIGRSFLIWTDSYGWYIRDCRHGLGETASLYYLSQALLFAARLLQGDTPQQAADYVGEHRPYHTPEKHE